MPTPIQDWLATVERLLPNLAMMLGVAFVALLGLLEADRRLRVREDRKDLSPFRRHLIMLGLTLAGALAVAMVSPDPQLGLQAVGVAATIILTLASSTLVANGLAGVMLQAQRHFRAGDYLRVRDDFGKVRRQGLFFTQLETDLADLITLPNMYLATHPVTVIRGKRTLISAELSLGYDVSRRRVAELLQQAVGAAGLDPEKSFVHVLELGDYSVRYRLSAELTDLQHLLTQQSRLKEAVLDTLHGAGVEIASPSIMLQRPAPADQPILPDDSGVATDGDEPRPEAEKLMFQRALEGETAEKLNDLLKDKRAEIDELRKGDGEPDAEIETLERHVALIEGKIRELKEKAES